MYDYTCENFIGEFIRLKAKIPTIIVSSGTLGCIRAVEKAYKDGHQFDAYIANSDIWFGAPSIVAAVQKAQGAKTPFFQELPQKHIPVKDLFAAAEEVPTTIPNSGNLNTLLPLSVQEAAFRLDGRAEASGAPQARGAAAARTIDSMLQDKIAIVTGAAGGIGLATAREFARQGATLMLVDLDDERLAIAADAVRAVSTGPVATTAADVSTGCGVRGYVDATLEAFGRIDVLFNNAGIGGAVADIAEYDEDEFDRVIAINLRSVFLGLRHVLPAMLANGSGAIISTASIAGEVGLPGTCAYNASKHGLIGLTKTAAAEVGRLGIRVNAVCPGAVDTPLLRAFAAKFSPDDPDGAWDQLADRQPNGRLGTPEEIAAVVAFLASDEASYVSGVAWPVDGGALGTMSNPS